MPELPGALTLEQELKLHATKMYVTKLGENELKNYLVELIRQKMIKDNLAKEMLRQGIGVR